MMKQLYLITFSLCCTLLLANCSTKPTKEVIEDLDHNTIGYYVDATGNVSYMPEYYSSENQGGLIKASYKAIDALLKIATDLQRYPNKPILISSFVNVDNVQTSSTFGRIVAEQMSARITQHGYKVKEMKLRNSLFIKEKTGELLLSRELQDISLQHDAFAVLVGTYAASKRKVYVNAKLVSAQDSVILAAYDYELPVGPDTKYLLQMR